MKTLTITFLLCGLITIGVAQPVSKIENIKKLLEMTGTGKIGVQAAQNMLGSFKSSYTNVPDDFWENFKKELNPDTLINMIIPIYDKYYQDEDIKQLIAFYQSPIGKKVIAITPQVMQESMLAGQVWGKRIGEKVVGNLKAKGYLKAND